MSKNKLVFLIYLFLIVTTLLPYWQIGNHSFIIIDDPDYITENHQIQDGVTIQALRWAFTTGYVAFWCPVTWISHMVDVQLFGLNPGPHHLMSLLFHIANVLLLFFALHRMTKRLWPSAFVAALFALHSLHVESVVWACERRDVLSAFFWMLTLIAYSYYAQSRRFRSYLAVAAFFILGLMSKPMMVTLPFVLLLLDYWPLGRFAGTGPAQAVPTEASSPVFAHKQSVKTGKQVLKTPVEAGEPAEHEFQRASIRSLVLEKIPLLALTVLSCVVTYIAEDRGQAIPSADVVPLSLRIANAFVSYCIYITKMIWPAKLAVFYPLPGSLPFWQVLAAVVFLAAVTYAVVRAAKRFPYLPVGWLWFTGTFVPVIGIIQVGSHGMADRYTYIPSIGFFIMAAWGIPELFKKRRHGIRALATASALCLLFLFALTWTQVGYWRDSITLFDHALSVTDNNHAIYCCRGLAQDQLGNHAQAIEDFSKSIGMSANSAQAYSGRGVAYGAMGNYSQALEDFDRAIRLDPKMAKAYSYRGNVRNSLGDHTGAIEDFDRAIEINPTYSGAYNNRGITYQSMGNYSRAIEDFGRAIEINAADSGAYNNRGTTYQDMGNYSHAIEDFDRAIRIAPANAGTYFNRGLTYQKMGNYSRAIEDYDTAIKIAPAYVGAYYNRGRAHSSLGNQRQATEDLKTAARLGHEKARKTLKSQGIDW